MSGPFLGHFRLCLIDSTEVTLSKVAKFGSMDIAELHGDILQPWGQLETPGLVDNEIQQLLILTPHDRVEVQAQNSLRPFMHYLPSF